MIIDTTLTSYVVRFRCVRNQSSDRAQIYCYSPNMDTELVIAFQSEGEQAGNAKIDTLANGRRRVTTYFPLHMFAPIHHVLQTEEPITLYATDSNNYTQVSLGTATGAPEPIGEGEGR